ncbi:MAG: hypothetical protein FWC68_04945 [Oscillospiraceae bacterium]|nr:hypothetical protein [Oscillospiraceae bacterium]
MGDTLISVFVIFIVAILMVVYPLLAISENSERVTQLAAQTVTAEFVDKVTTMGVIRASDFDNFIQRLHATGSTFNVEIEVIHIDENPSRNTTYITQGRERGRNLAYSVFTSTILQRVLTEDGDGAYLLKQGDTVIVTIGNTNRTIAQLLRDFFYSASRADDHQVGASFSGTVVNNGRI